MKKIKTLLFFLTVSIFLNCQQKEIKPTSINPNKFPISPCKEVMVIGKDSVKRKVMKETISFFVGTNCFVNDRGIIKLFISSDKKGNEVWKLYATIENEHMWSSRITPFFEVFNGDMVLVFYEDYMDKYLKMSPEQKQEVYTCTDQIIGDRVYEKPTRKDRWSSNFHIIQNENMREFYQGEIGDTISGRGQHRIYTRTSCKRKVTFYKDGTYEAINKSFY